jgi:zinc transport system ATP-binding protein
MNNTLEVYFGEELIFCSDGKWLYPLFELEDFLAGVDLEPARLTVKDKIVGRAAALLEIRLGVGRVEAGTMSELGRRALERHNVPHEYEILVERILCQTEELLDDEYDPERAYEILKARAGR